MVLRALWKRRMARGGLKLSNSAASTCREEGEGESGGGGGDGGGGW